LASSNHILLDLPFAFSPLFLPPNSILFIVLVGPSIEALDVVYHELLLIYSARKNGHEQKLHMNGAKLN